MASQLTVASFNIRNGRAYDGLDSWPFRRRALRDAVADLDADLIGLQEVLGFQLRFLRTHLGGYEIVGDARSGRRWGERCPVAMRKNRVRSIDEHTLWYGSDPTRGGSRLAGASFPRIATLCTVQTSSSEVPVQFVSTHFDERIAHNRVRSAEQLISWLNPGLPSIIAGDLNDEPESETLSCFLSAGLHSVLEEPAHGTAHAFSGRTDVPRIDHLLVSEHFDVRTSRVVSSRYGDRLASDHWPVVATLEWA